MVMTAVYWSDCISGVLFRGHRDHVVNLTGAIQSLGNAASVLILALPNWVPPEFLPEWISGPVVIFLMSACTGLAAIAALLEPVSSLFNNGGKAVATALQQVGCLAMAAPIMALLIAIKNTVYARFQRIFFTRGKAKMKMELEKQAKRRASVVTLEKCEGAGENDADFKKLHDHHPVPGHEENCQIYVAFKLDGDFEKLSADDKDQFSKDLVKDLTIVLHNEHVVHIECRHLRGGSIIADCVLTLKSHHTDGESAVAEIEDQIDNKRSALRRGNVSKRIVAISDPHQIYPHFDLDNDKGIEVAEEAAAMQVAHAREIGGTHDAINPDKAFSKEQGTWGASPHLTSPHSHTPPVNAEFNVSMNTLMIIKENQIARTRQSPTNVQRNFPTSPMLRQSPTNVQRNSPTSPMLVEAKIFAKMQHHVAIDQSHVASGGLFPEQQTLWQPKYNSHILSPDATPLAETRVLHIDRRGQSVGYRDRGGYDRGEDLPPEPRLSLHHKVQEYLEAKSRGNEAVAAGNWSEAVAAYADALKTVQTGQPSGTVAFVPLHSHQPSSYNVSPPKTDAILPQYTGPYTHRGGVASGHLNTQGFYPSSLSGAKESTVSPSIRMPAKLLKRPSL